MVNDVRLSQLSTRWTLLVAAQRRDDPTAARDAQAELLPRYCAAIYRYLLRSVHDPAAADDLCQEFAFRFIRGDFRHARPEKGRFRDYVKVSLFHLVGGYRRGKRGEELQIPFDSRLLLRDEPPTDEEVVFREEWRQELLDRTWAELRRACDGTPPTAYDALRAKADHPTVASATLAGRFTDEFGRPVTEANVRQLIHRGRERFAELLRREVGVAVQASDPAAIDEELAELGLLAYCPRRTCAES